MMNFALGFISGIVITVIYYKLVLHVITKRLQEMSDEVSDFLAKRDSR